jgi:hypothetical protein
MVETMVAPLGERCQPLMRTIIQLIYDYTTMTKAAAVQLQREFGVENLLQAWMHRQVPQRGILSDGSAYQFHGIGCCIERTDGLDVDFDFGPGGRADGFDAWRLWQFAKQFPTQYPDFQQREHVEKALSGLADEGIVSPSGADHDNLLYLRS